MKTKLGAAVSVAALGCSLGMTTAVAAAPPETNVVTVIQAQDRILNHAVATERLAHFDLRSVPSARVARPALPALRGFIRDLRSDVAAVANATTSGPRQRQGRADYVHGVRIQISGFGDIARALTDVITGRSTAARRAYTNGQRLLGSGNVIANRGDRLLGLSTHY